MLPTSAGVGWGGGGEIWFRIVNGQISSLFNSYMPATDPYFHFRMITLVNINGFSLNSVCALIMEICFGTADRQISSIFDSYLPMTRPYFHFWTITLVNINGFSPSLVCTLILWTSALGLLIVKVRPFLTELFTRNTSVFTFRTIT